MKLETYFKDDGKDAEIMVILAYMLKKAYTGSKLTKIAILENLNNLYGITMTRATFDKKLKTLSHYGYDTRQNELGGWELVGRELDDAQIRFLADCLIYSNAVSQENAEEMIKGLCQLGTEISDKNLGRYISRMKKYSSKCKDDVMYTLGLVLNSIRNEKKLSVNYKVYNKDLNIVKKYEESIMISPYELVMSNGRYVLICAVDGEDCLSNFYLDRLTNVLDTREPVRPIKELPGFRSANALEEYIRSSPTLSGGIVDRFSIKCDNDIVGEIAEAFFGKVRLDRRSRENDSHNTVLSVRTTAETLKRIILPYADKVTVLNGKLSSDIGEVLREGLYNVDMMNKNPLIRAMEALSFKKAAEITAEYKLDMLTYAPNKNKGYFEVVEDISLFEKLGHLKALYLDDLDITVGDFIRYMPKLKVLSLKGCKYDFSQLTSLTEPEDLTLDDIDTVKASMLKDIAKPEILEIYFSKNDEAPCDLEFVKDMKHLSTLRLYNCQRLTDISALAELTKLKSLQLINCTGLEDISVLFAMKNLAALTLSGTNISLEEESKLRNALTECSITIKR